LRQSPLQIFVPVEAPFGVVREVRADLEKERPEVVVGAVEIKMVDQRRGLHDPGIDRAGFGIAPLLGAKHGRLLLRLTDHQHPLAPLRPMAKR
jgi:hypothetical protein